VFEPKSAGVSSALAREKSMQMQRLRIDDYENWGKLVKTWATGNNTYLQDGNSYPIPQDLGQLRDQMAMAGAGMVPITDTEPTIQFVTMDENTLLIQLPPKQIIEDIESQLQKGVPYPLPAFYQSTVGGQIRDSLKFNHERVGEYTVLFCA
jgi:hypothetical protein